MVKIEGKLEFDMPRPGRLWAQLKTRVRRPWQAAARGGGSASSGVAPRDAGWAELLTSNGQTRMGRGHLMIWPTDSPHPGLGERDRDDSGPARVGTDSGLPVGGDAPHLRGELRSFTVDAGPPVRGDTLVVRPENETDMYSVVVERYDGARGQNVVHLDWPDERLPAALRELGGD
ncbi:MAG: hypothetical protein M0R73_03275 [Dehalococcoidia bacterium]|nr:hypothetical protein [Dehalococcoidia bacterium]